MKNEITVGPVEGRSLPLEHNARERITRPTTVPADSPYYQRALAAGDVVLVNHEAEPVTPAPEPVTPPPEPLNPEPAPDAES